ncbi:MAG: hypothetical protein C0425_04695 [Chlorobiaceae bacterium]|nr:hypothetical protein [Chlorobiaceae bacterium]MBA4309615.1 hypothetical protein [Chlorobiaceae bacterium]
MISIQKKIILKSKKRGFHLITHEVLAQLSEIKKIEIGIAHLFIQHTSASLTLNENATPDVRVDLENSMNKIVPEGSALYTHRFEGSDDMPAHIKASLLGSSLTIPITNGAFNLGTWQGIYLCEHRNDGGARNIVVTLFGN